MYFDAMDELLAGDPAVRPVQVVSSDHTSPTRTLQPAASPQRLSGGSALSSDSGEETPVVRKRRRSSASSQDPPEWLAKYLERSEARMDKLEETVARLTRMSSERNLILSKIAEALTKR